jgi:hypothetical protein
VPLLRFARMKDMEGGILALCTKFGFERMETERSNGLGRESIDILTSLTAKIK